MQLWDRLARGARARTTQGRFRVVILPELGGFSVESPAFTDAILVEHLIDLLHDAGYADVVVAASSDSSALWAGNRDVLALADLLGYRFLTPAGRDYDIVDLGEDLVDGGFAPGEVLNGSTLSRAWLDAGFRIVFSKNRCDDADGYALCLDTMLAALPLVDELYHYRLARDPGDVVRELLGRTPVHLALIDGIVSCHGSGGTRAPEPIVTDRVVAASSAWLADHVGALAMGLDPAVSRLARRSPMAGASLREATIHGPLRAPAGWRNVHPQLIDATRRRDLSPTFARLIRPWLQVLDPELFPLRSPIDARINRRVASLFRDVDDDPAAFALLVFANHTLANLQQALDAYRAMYAKDHVRRAQVPLGLDLGRFTPSDYEALVRELAALEPYVADAPERADGLRWREMDGAVVFEYTRVLPVDFDEFVASVDVTRTIQYMNDYLGGVIVPIAHDARGRVVRQAERNLYLPQPNYLALAQAKPIDVAKLEVAVYGDDDHRMYWKTVESPNGSAVHDDGIVTFLRVGGSTAITIVGRQRFVLPPFWQSVDLDLLPELKAHLVTDAYRTFFDRTIANLEALVEGREIRIRRGWVEPSSPEATEPLPSAAVERAIETAMERLADLRSAGVRARMDTTRPARTARPVRVDDDGFAHFQVLPHAQGLDADGGLDGRPGDSGLGALADFWSGLMEALARDAATLQAWPLP
ncbi:MAG TPA: DUF362 domain-containing protein [Nitriliruptorales bacterium]|nr:DUF362 domain-containing protein [Nitriliruptorales bacterium]